MRILIIGLGQMGGSLAWDAKDAGHYVLGYNKNREVIHYALEKGVIDQEIESLDNLADEKLELIIVCASLKAYPDIFDRLDQYRDMDWVVTDIGSVKESPMDQVEKYGNLSACFLGGHPMAGTERAGIENMSRGLYRKRRWFVTEFSEAVYGGRVKLEQKRERLYTFLGSIGARPMGVKAREHDFWVGSASHLPQAISVILGASLMDNHEDGSYMDAVGGGFRDVSRLGGSSAAVWEDIMFLNRENLLKELSDFSYTLDGFMEALDRKDEQVFRDIFMKANRTRRLFLEKAEELGLDV